MSEEQNFSKEQNFPEEQNFPSEKIEKQTENIPAEQPQKNEPEDNELVKCKKERDEYLDGWRRAKAELLNYKKDEAKRFEMMVSLANETLLKKLLLVLDSFELGLIASEKEAAVQKGLYLIFIQLKDILKSFGLEEIKISPGQKFEPSFHESVAEVEAAQPSGTIAEEVEKGYLLSGQVIRPSKVKVTK